MRRRIFIKGAAAAGLAGAATSGFAAPAISQGRMEWRMVTTWPKNFPGLGTAAELLADFITKGTDGRLSVKVYGAGEIVPAFEAMDAVASGTVEMGHGASYYWKGKVAAAQFLTAFPFGLLAQEQNAWFQSGGGQEIADEIYRELGCKFFPSGNTGTQMGGWFNKEINSAEDYKGLKMRMPGLGGEVIKAAGANVVNLPGAEIPPSLQSGAIDAAEWVGPYNDLAFGLYKSARFYYYPGWQEPCATLDNFINNAAWEKLPNDIKSVIAAANAAVNQQVLSEFMARNNASLRTLIDEHGVILKKFPDDVLRTLAGLSEDVMNDLASRDPLSRKVMDSMLTFRTDASAWTAIAETAMSAARSLQGDGAAPEKL
jgi:TRAP-type mannitol/chloroaromatic compound transport system substrate-binding protein